MLIVESHVYQDVSSTQGTVESYFELLCRIDWAKGTSAVHEFVLSNVQFEFSEQKKTFIDFKVGGGRSYLKLQNLDLNEVHCKELSKCTFFFYN